MIQTLFRTQSEISGSGAAPHVGDVGLGDGRPSDGVEALPDAAHHRAEHPEQSRQLGQRHRGRGDVFVQRLARHHVVQVLETAGGQRLLRGLLQLSSEHGARLQQWIQLTSAYASMSSRNWPSSVVEKVRSATQNCSKLCNQPGEQDGWKTKEK